MSDAAISVLRKNLADLSANLRRLERSHERCVAISVKAEYTDDEFDAFENRTSRFARTTDLLMNKTLRSIDTAEFLDSGSIIDSANRAEKRGIIDSVSVLRDLKDLRNEIAHEYETDDLPSLFGTVLKSVPDLIATADRIAAYCERFLV